MPVHAPGPPLAGGLTQESAVSKLSAPELIVLPEAAGRPALPFLLLRDRWRTLRITVRPDGGVTVKVPIRARIGDVLAAVNRKRAWIEAKRTFFRQRPLPPPRAYVEGEIFYYLGRPFRLRFTAPGTAGYTGTGPGRRRAAVAQLWGSELLIRPGRAPLTPDAVRRAVEHWRQKTTESLLRRRLIRLHAQACARLGDRLPLPTLKVRSLKRRWGSCSARGEITLARQLSAVPPVYVDYVIFHELCHLRHMNHGPRFHALLDALVPGAAALARELHLWGLEHPKD